MPPNSFLMAFRNGYDALGLGQSQPVYAGYGPADKPGRFTTLIPTGGNPFTFPSNDLRRITVQVNTWGPANGFGIVYEQAVAALEALHELYNWSLTGYLVERIHPLQEPHANGVENGIVCVTFNLFLYVRKVST